jgi:uncharacterized protein YlbG (UPF0298 family)
MRHKRLGLAVWVKNIKTARNLRKFGNVHYISKRYNYVSMYVKAEDFESIVSQLRRLDYVTQVEPSHRHQIPTEFNNSRPDKAKEYDYKLKEAAEAKELSLSPELVKDSLQATY